VYRVSGLRGFRVAKGFSTISQSMNGALLSILACDWLVDSTRDDARAVSIVVLLTHAMGRSRIVFESSPPLCFVCAEQKVFARRRRGGLLKFREKQDFRRANLLFTRASRYEQALQVFACPSIFPQPSKP